jgi:hypothetical protein
MAMAARHQLEQTTELFRHFPAIAFAKVSYQPAKGDNGQWREIRRI